MVRWLPIAGFVSLMCFSKAHQDKSASTRVIFQLMQ